jgi:hypothetical protein
MKIRIVKKGLPKAQQVGEIKDKNSVVVGGVMYFEGDPGYEEAKEEVRRMKSQMFNLRDVNNTIQDLKSFVPKIKPAVGNAINTAVTTAKPFVNNAIEDVKETLPKVRPAIKNAFQSARQFASNAFPKINLGSSAQSQPQSSQQPATQEPAQASASSTPPMNPWAFLNPMGVQNYFGDIMGGKTNYISDTQNVADAKLQQKYPTLGATPREQEIQKIGMATPLSNLTAEPEPFDIGKAARTVSTIGDGLQIAGAAVDYFDQNRKRKEFDRNFRRNQFDVQATSPMFRGNWNINTGRFRDDVTKQPNEGMFQMGGEENFINVDNTMKIRITGRPQNLEFEYGGQSGFGLNLGQRRVQTEMPQSKADSVRRTIQEVPRDKANIEAEYGETVLGDLDGDGFLEHMNIGGERHYNGGTPLNVPEGSFVFSDTAKMRIKDPEALKYFGLSPKKGGYTPAEIAKRYDINKYKAIIEDKNADERSKSTALLMRDKYNRILSKLAILQESMKGFPQGIPTVAQESEKEMAMAKYGGSLPKFQGDRSGSTVGSGSNFISPEVVQYLKDQALLKFLEEQQRASTQTGTPSAAQAAASIQAGTPVQTGPIVFDQTLSPKELAALSDPEFARYQELINKYDTNLKKDAITINSMSPQDAKEFARLATKFGFKRTDDQGKPLYHVIQGSTPGLTFTGTSGKKAGFFGGYTPDLYERRVVEDLLGEDATKNMSELDVRKAYFKELGVDTTGLSDEQLSDAKSLYSNKNFFEKQFYPKFVNKFVSSDYRTQLGDDMMIGAEHYDSYRQKDKPVITTPGSVPGFKCTGLSADGMPNIVPSSHPSAEARAAAGAYATSQEAAMHCPGGSIPGKIREGEIPKEQKPGFLTPDKLALLNAGLNPPKAYFPFAPPVNFRKGNLTLDDWLAQAQQRGSMMNTAASTLGQYQPGTALASNLSFLAGQTGEGVSQDIATVNSRNVDRANQFMSQEVQRQGYNDMLNAQRMQELFDKGTITKQQYDNALKKYTSGITRAANNAWGNRMYLDMINKVNPVYNVDPRSGLSYFKQGYGTDMFGRTGSGSAPSFSDFSNLKNQFLKVGMSEANAESEALRRIRGGNTSYSDTNVDGLPDSVRTTVPGGAVGLANAYMNAFGNFTPPSMFGGQIGPWVNKKKK